MLRRFAAPRVAATAAAMRTAVTSFEGTRNDFVFETKEGSVIVDFYTDWCGPCKQFAPTFLKMSEENPNVKFLKVNVEDNEEVGAAFNVRSIPTIVALKDGEIVKTVEGPIVAKINEALAKIQ